MPNWFAAIPVSLHADDFSSLRTRAPEGLRWFALEDLHLTIAFFGAFRTERFEAVRNALLDLPRPDIRMTAGHLLPLPSERHFSAVSLSVVEGRNEVIAFTKRYHPALMRAAELPPDEREPLPHITIARPRRKAPHSERRAILQWMAQKPAPRGIFHLNRLALYRGLADRTARQFEIIAVNRGPDPVTRPSRPCHQRTEADWLTKTSAPQASLDENQIDN